MIDGPYKLPEGWRWVRLGEVASEIQSGFAFRKKGARAGEVLHLRPYNIGNDGELKLDQQFKIPNTALPEHWSYLYPGDVLFNNTNSVELVGKTAIVKTVLQAVFSNHITRIRACLDKCEGEWLALALRTLWQQGFFAQQCNKWVGQAGYNTKMLKKTLIPLPPLNEQQRIVAKVEMLMEQVHEARNLRQKACEDTDRLWQAVLADTFPRPGTDLPPNWRWVRLVEIFEFQQGVSMSSKRRQGKNPKPFLRTRNIFWGKADISSIDEMDFTDEEIEKFRLQSGDLLVCEGGDVGKTAIWEEQLPLVLYQNHIHRLRPVNALIESRFFMYWMQTAYKVFQEYQGLESRTAIPNLSSSRLKQFVAPLPPLDVQRHVVAHLKATQEKIKTLKDSQAQFETELQRLEQSILDSAFKGEL